MSAAPRHSRTKADRTVLIGALRMDELNINSCAISSTRAVYIKMPADIASKTPFVINVVRPSGG